MCSKGGGGANRQEDQEVMTGGVGEETREGERGWTPFCTSFRVNVTTFCIQWTLNQTSKTSRQSYCMLHLHLFGSCLTFFFLFFCANFPFWQSSFVTQFRCILKSHDMCPKAEFNLVLIPVTLRVWEKWTKSSLSSLLNLTKIAFPWKGRRKSGNS